MTDIIERLGDVPLVAILRAPDASRFAPVADVLSGAGLRAIEVTLSTAGALESISALRARLPADVLVGAGTIRSRSDFRAAQQAGADFFVSQIASGELRRAAAELDVEYIPGALTPTEVAKSRAHGADIVKVSPIGPVGGVSYLRELLAPMPDARLFVTGGLRLEDVVGYLDAGAAAVGLSRYLVEDALEHGGDVDALGARASAVVNEVRTRRRMQTATGEEAGR